MNVVIMLIIRGYQLILSPFIHWIAGPGSGCRHIPSCSENFIIQTREFGPYVGIKKALVRLLNCHPWGK